jgi:D-glycero-alpha-D-manno-heptose-7-phosphate kinase
MSGLIRARAPLRLGLAGGGTDVSPYCDEYGGAVLNVTIDRFAFASIEPRQDGAVSFVAADLGTSDVLEAAPVLPTHEGLRLHRAVYNRIVRDFNDGRPLAITLTTHVDSPMGSGLGSSSALVVAMVEAMRDYVGAPLGEYDIAHLAFEIERKDLRLNGGRQDQYAATFGGFNYIEFGANDRVIVNPLRIKPATRFELEASLLLYFTGVSRESARIIDNQTASVRKGGQSLDAMHRMKADAIEMKEALLLGRLGEMGELMNRGWLAKKATSEGVSNPLIESILETARANGARSAKVSGAGGGGFVMLLCDPVRRTGLSRALAELGHGEPMICQLTNEGSVSWRVR